MSPVRVNLLYMSVHGGILVFVVLLLRQIFQGKLPRRTQVCQENDEMAVSQYLSESFLWDLDVLDMLTIPLII